MKKNELDKQGLDFFTAMTNTRRGWISLKDGTGIHCHSNSLYGKQAYKYEALGLVVISKYIPDEGDENRLNHDIAVRLTSGGKDMWLQTRVPSVLGNRRALDL